MIKKLGYKDLRRLNTIVAEKMNFYFQECQEYHYGTNLRIYNDVRYEIFRKHYLYINYLLDRKLKK